MLGRATKVDLSDGSRIRYTYNNLDQTTKKYYKYNSEELETSFTYNKASIPNTTTFNNGATKQRTLNNLTQISSTTLNTHNNKAFVTNISYLSKTENGATYTSNAVSEYSHSSINKAYSLSYNGAGNISNILETSNGSSVSHSFVYDELNQLIRENNAKLNKTITYTYDAGGNILSVKEYPYTLDSLGEALVTKTYSYTDTEWKDLLTAYNGNTITYDTIGNPLTYKNGESLTWQNGRQLANLTKADGTALSFAYNDSGIRTKKTVNGVTTEYFLDGTEIIAQKTGNNVIWYYYDSSGTREAIKYGDEVYYYFYTPQGDVAGIYDKDLNIVVEYVYDSWGNIVSTSGPMAETLGVANPFRYRGYYYDNETGFYYLNSRYYDPETGRFINADGYLSTGQGLTSTNMFAYCGNNPVHRLDLTGTMYAEHSGLAGYGGIGATYSRAIATSVTKAAIVAGAATAAVGITALRQEMFAIREYNREKAKEKEKTIPIPNTTNNGKKYYHSTTLENFLLIKTSGVMKGSSYESGYVYAWKLRPSRAAIKNSGAHTGVLISFRTNESFVKDTGINDWGTSLYGPVVSSRPGPIAVWDVYIVGVS